MNREMKVALDFNTAITGLDKSTGKWDEKAHNEAVKPLRGLIMQIDGTYGCYIGRYGMEIQYMSGVTSKARVIKAAKAAVRETSSKEGFFPLRGKKTPTARAPKPAAPSYDTWWAAKVTFNTDLFVKRDETSTNEIVDKLTSRLAEADGARQPGVGQRVMYVKFNRKNVLPESMEAHLQTVVAEIMAARSEEGYFPFAEPVFSYETFRTNSII